MKSWEYLVLTLSGAECEESNVIYNLDAVADGWELVSAFTWHDGMERHERYIFKREMEK